MIALILTVLAVFAVLMMSEVGWRRGVMTNEIGRKFVHITVGSFVAFWPLYLSWNQIRLLSLAFIAVTILSRFFHVFQAIHSVQRPTYGEFFFAVTVGLLTYITQSKAIYAASLLQMSLADGMAAVLGVEYGLKHARYHILGHIKTVVGTATFFVVSLAILLGYGADATNLPLDVSFALAAAATLLENIGVAGLDNLLVPLVIALVLNHL